MALQTLQPCGVKRLWELRARFMLVAVLAYCLNLPGLWITKLPSDSIRHSGSGKKSTKIPNPDLCILYPKKQFVSCSLDLRQMFTMHVQLPTDFCFEDLNLRSRLK